MSCPDPTVWTLLPRHGARPFGFHGRLLLQASNRDDGRFVWSEIEIHQPTGHGYVVAVRHHTADRAVPLWQHAVVCVDAAAVQTFLHTHDPVMVLPIGIVATAACLSGADALLAAVQDAVGHQRAGWQALLAAMFGPTGERCPSLLRSDTMA